jgi:hypothetical protein
MVFQFGSIFGTTQRPDEERIEQRFSHEIEKNRTRTSFIGHFIGEQGHGMLEMRDHTIDVILIDEGFLKDLENLFPMLSKDLKH